MQEKEGAKDKSKKEQSKKSQDSNNDPLEKILGGNVSSSEKETKFFGMELPKTDSNLLGQLAKAIVQQEEKEVVRGKEQEKLVAMAEEKKKPNVLPLDTNSGNSTKPSDNTSDNLTPIEPVKPPVIPDNPEPVDPSTPTIEELTENVKMDLQTATDKAKKINNRLEKVKERLSNLIQIEDRTAENVSKSTALWEEVATLVSEYNQLSEQIKQLITDKNEVLPVNQQLYQETYNQLQQKVSEIKAAQNKANESTNNTVNTVVEATKTEQNLDTIEQHYEDKLSNQADTAKNNVGKAIDKAQENADVATNLQTEIVQAEASAVHIQNNQEKIEQDLEVANQVETQEKLNNAQQSVEALKETANSQNEIIATVVEDFNQLPVVESEKVSEQETIQNDSTVSVQGQEDKKVAPADETIQKSTETVIEESEITK